MDLEELIDVMGQIVRLAPGHWTFKVRVPRGTHTSYGLSLRDENANVLTLYNWDDALDWIRRQQEALSHA